MVELEHSSPMIVANYWMARFIVAYTRRCILGTDSQIQLTEQSKLSIKIKEIMTSSDSLLEVEEMGIQNILHSVVAYRKSVMVRHKPIAQIFRRFLEDKCFPAFQAGSDPIVISLDKRGRLVHYNALHMILTWRDQLYQETTMSHDLIPSLEDELRERTLGANRVIDDIDTQIHDFASEVRKNINNWVKDMKDKMKNSFRSYNYTSEMEQILWDKESWSLKLVVSNIFNGLDKRIDDEEYIFLCGGNNNKQVQEVILKIQEVCSKLQMNRRILYIGRSEKTLFDDEVRRMCDYKFYKYIIIKEFWTRLQSIVSSRIQYLFKMRRDERKDEIMHGVKKLLAYEGEGSTVGVWALLSKGNRIIACDMGDKMLGVLNEYEKWKDSAQINGFERAFKDCYDMLNSSSPTSYQHSHCSLNYPSNLDKIPDTQSCPQCNHHMHKFVTFSCCHTFIDH
ncbi:protein SIEVE ELEMENT OCCLUSION B-like isoform X2 [Ipomoea triloba]|uniref:protein SIEVE ELEMENT OCCLUSION B-like isoform X2 n=1 Tax=Ipomoea triloba TaxID=35885 RepID=UPI00125CEB5E|nr:protein SIEVE ELEMENT OCCLUSION B-like isoform X2 [Ipomoea triloba]